MFRNTFIYLIVIAIVKSKSFIQTNDSLVESATDFSGNECNLVINKINTGIPELIQKKDFIELKLICQRSQSKSLQGYTDDRKKMNPNIKCSL